MTLRSSFAQPRGARVFVLVLAPVCVLALAHSRLIHFERGVNKSVRSSTSVSQTTAHCRTRRRLLGAPT